MVIETMVMLVTTEVYQHPGSVRWTSLSGLCSPEGLSYHGRQAGQNTYEIPVLCRLLSPFETDKIFCAEVKGTLEGIVTINSKSIID